MDSFTSLKQSFITHTRSIDSRSEQSDQQRSELRPDSGVVASESQQTCPPEESVEQINLESQKVIISKAKWPLGLLVHIGPILAAVCIIAINFHGYFIGTQFVGVTNSTSQSIVLSALQVTAKLFELIVIASLGYLVLDIVHHFLFFDDAGLPLALTGIRLNFTNVFFLLSPTFWSGIQAFRSRRAQLLVVFLLLSCGLIATFVGPAAALLLIPPIRTNWLAGSFFYQTAAGQQLTWNTRLDYNNTNICSQLSCNIVEANGSSYTGIPPNWMDSCIGPSEDAANYPGGEFADCIWAGTNSLGSAVTSFTIPWSGNVTVNDEGRYGRDISWSTYNVNQSIWNVEQKRPTIWAWTSMQEINEIASALFQSWSFSLNGTTSLWGQYGRYAYRDQLGTQTKLQGMLAPIARSSCQWSQRNFNDSRPYAFPVAPLYGVAPEDTNATYMLPATLVNNTSTVRTFWVSKPSSTPNVQGADPDTEYTTHLPSAFLIAQFPMILWSGSLEDVTYGPVMTCSIDAYWINANQSTVLFNEAEFNGIGVPTTYTDIDKASFDAQGRPIPNKLSTRIDLDDSWLNVLTPVLNQTISNIDLTQQSFGYTYLSKVLDSLKTGHDEGTINFDQGLEDMLWRLQLLLSLLTVDGIARTYAVAVLDAAEEFVEEQQSDPWYYGAMNFDPTGLLVAGGKPPLIQQDLSGLGRSELLWTATISGYAYAADSTAYILAIAVLFSYIFFAVCHICFACYKRWYSEIWWSIPDIVALTLRSPPSAILNNISAGTDLRNPNKLLMKLRSKDEFEENVEMIHLLVDGAQGESSRAGAERYYKVEKGRKYR